MATNATSPVAALSDDSFFTCRSAHVRFDEMLNTVHTVSPRVVVAPADHFYRGTRTQKLTSCIATAVAAPPPLTLSTAGSLSTFRPPPPKLPPGAGHPLMIAVPRPPATSPH